LGDGVGEDFNAAVFAAGVFAAAGGAAFLAMDMVTRPGFATAPDAKVRQNAPAKKQAGIRTAIIQLKMQEKCHSATSFERISGPISLLDNRTVSPFVNRCLSLSLFCSPA
jgi:hypothetical protein